MSSTGLILIMFYHHWKGFLQDIKEKSSPAGWAGTGSMCWLLPGIAQTSWQVERWWCCTWRSWCSYSGERKQVEGFGFWDRWCATVREVDSYCILKLLVVLSVVGPDPPLLLCTERHNEGQWVRLGWRPNRDVTECSQDAASLIWKNKLGQNAHSGLSVFPKDCHYQ